MEKEQKKLLLVAVSVGVFLLVTITAAMVILTPKIPALDTSYLTSVPFRPGNVQENTVNNTLQPIINNPQETSTVFESVPEAPVVIEKPNNDNLVVNIPRPNTAAVPDSPEIPTTTNVAPKPQTPAVSRPPATIAAPVAQTPVRPAATSGTPARTINDYWIQAGAYLALVRAEDVKELLASNGLTSIIENRVIDGKLYYRVRLGPYTSEREANYWLTLVKSIEGFGESQVRQTARQL
jgi:DedD protein